jgi:hypothetical protein
MLGVPHTLEFPKCSTIGEAATVVIITGSGTERYSLVTT